jgi:hypothetical protein
MSRIDQGSGTQETTPERKSGDESDNDCVGVDVGESEVTHKKV